MRIFFRGCLSLLARDADDKAGPDSIDGVDQAASGFLVRACGLTYHSSSSPKVGLVGWAPPSLLSGSFSALIITGGLRMGTSADAAHA